MAGRRNFANGLLVLSGLVLSLVLLEGSLRLAGRVFRAGGSGGGEEPAPVPGEYRILCLGDSMTADVGPGAWPRFLERYLKEKNPSVAFRVVNRGQVGASSSYLLDRAEGYVRSLRPQLVVAMMGINDGRSSLPALHSPWRRRVEEMRVCKLVRLLARRMGQKRDELRAPRRAGVSGGRSHAVRAPEKPVPEQVRSLMDRGRRCLDLGWGEQGLRLLESAVAACPDQATVRAALADGYVRAHRMFRAYPVYEKALELDADNLRALTGSVACLLQFAEYAKAEALCRRALERYPGRGDLLVLMGGIFQKLNRNEEAERILTGALRADPLNARRHWDLGSFYADTGRAAQARDCFEASVCLAPGFAPGYFSLGLLCRKAGDLGQARALWTRAVRLDPHEPYYCQELSSLCRETGAPEAALQALKLAVRNNPGNPLLRIDYWQCLYACGKPVPDRLVLAPVRIDPACAQGYLEAGLYYLYDRKDPEKARPLLRRYEELFSEHSGLDFVAGPEGGVSTRNPSLASPLLKADYQRLARLLAENGVPLVCVQYPLQPVENLRRLFDDSRGVVFVDNEKVFRDALGRHPYYELFTDRVGGDFGHATAEGNRLLAENIGAAVLEHFFPAGKKP